MAPAIAETRRTGPWGLFLALGVGVAFWGPALGVARGWFPAPLDDVYIHFDYARSLGQGHPFEWIAGQGYSSGETSPLYALILGLGWLGGFRGRALGVWAAMVAVASVASLLGSVRRLVRPRPPWLAWLLALVPLSLGIVDWALFSGMEVALFAAALGRALEGLAAVHAAPRGGPTREQRLWRLGLWGAALVLLRPEAVVVVAVLAIVAARAAGRRSGALAVARAAAPAAIATACVLSANHLATGDARSAGAALKLLSSNPFLSDEERARVFVENLVTFWVKVVRGELAVTPHLAATLPLLALVALVRGRRRAVAAACILSAVAWIALVTWNGNAPYHNFRYYAPALLLVAIAAALGIATLRRRWLAALVALGAIGVAAPKVPGQVRHFRAASANIRDQHVEVGARLASLPPDARILVGDAGAIPYVSGRSAVDALGLGGYRTVPFVRAAVHGEAAVIELIERLDPAARPTHLALYPNWFANLTSRFGVELDRVTIEDNVICGGTTKGIYRADWSALEPPGPRDADVLDELDVADVIDEAAHAYAAPLPHGGWTSLEIRAGRFDGGRTIPSGATESFVVRTRARGPVVLRVRVDDAARRIGLRRASGAASELALAPADAAAWRSATVTLEDVRDGERLTLEAIDGAYRDFHVWLERPRAASQEAGERGTLAR